MEAVDGEAVEAVEAEAVEAEAMREEDLPRLPGPRLLLRLLLRLLPFPPWEVWAMSWGVPRRGLSAISVSQTAGVRADRAWATERAQIRSWTATE